MPLDGITLAFVRQELGNNIIGSKVDKIHQPSKDEFILSLRSRESAGKLLVCASANCPRVHMTGRAPENPSTPPMLCMLMRKHLIGAVITDVRQFSLDRVLFIDFSGTNEIGDKTSLTLVVEIMAKHSNIILVNSDGLIIDSVKRVDFTQSSVRQILPGMKYVLPPLQNKLNITETQPSVICDKIFSLKEKMLSQAVLECVEGCSPLIARELASLSCGGDIPVSGCAENVRSRLCSEIERIRDMLLSAKGNPTQLVKDGGRLFDFTFTDITQFGFAVEGREKKNFSTLLDDFYSEKDRAERTRQRSSSLIKLLENSIARIRRKLEAQKQELGECADRDKYRIYAELILANQYRLGKGAPFFDLENFYDNNNPVRIPADPAISPSANAQKYFKEYRKLKTAEKKLAELIGQGEEELGYLESVLDSIVRAEGFTELNEIRAELYENGYLKRAGGQNYKKIKPMPPLEYISDDGYRILVGRNNLQNEMLTFRIARRDDSWFHVQKMPGSHVVVLGEGEEIPERTARQAAMLAAFHSGASESSGVPVDYTEVRYLKKPPESKTGKVIYHEYNTMWVTPDRDLCMRLRKDGKKDVNTEE